ncbi:MAG: biotin--[acetyl-CoA-carboxylase] ligase [Spirochaetota bacterium]
MVMVNEIDKVILTRLHREQAPLSGERLRSECGISRVAVWKHINRLRERGFLLSSSSKGYCLDGDSYDFERLHALGCAVVYEYRLASTMDLVPDNDSDEVIVLAEEQTGGRGKRSVVWHSPPGGIYYTHIWHPDIPLERVMTVMLAGAVSVACALREHGVEAMVKWPNDVLVGEKKIAGILVEFGGEYDWVKSVKTGFGINVNNQTHSTDTVSLVELLGRKTDRTGLLIRQFDLYNSLVRSEDAANRTVALWHTLSATLGRRVRMQTRDRTVTGLAKAVRDNGSLVVETDDGTVEVIASGSCEHL